MSDDAPSHDHQDHVKSSKTHAKAAAAEIQDAAAEMAREFQEQADTFAEQWKEKARHLQGEVENYVRENPTKSVLLAAGIGFVLGLAFRR